MNAALPTGMPRLIPRLIQRLQATRTKPAPVVPPERRPQPKPLRLPSKPRPRPPCPSLSPRGRTQSIVLDSLRPIMAVSRWRRHKEPGPRIRLSQRRKPSDTEDQTAPRAMTEEERELQANPYLRMLSTPIRNTIIGNSSLPTAFLIRLSVKRVPSPQHRIIILVADTLEHPAFRKPTRPGKGVYVSCRKEAVKAMDEKGNHKRVHQNTRKNTALEEQVGHLLRVRILQELRVLVRHLKRRLEGATDAPLLRRLTRAEWKELKASGTIPQEDAVAVLVVPPVNKNPATRTRPEPSMSSLPPPGAGVPNEDGGRPRNPVSTLMPTTTSDAFEDGKLSNILPHARVPLYNGVALFPDPQQRASCHKSLTELLHVERQARRREAAHSARQQGRSESASENAEPGSKDTARSRGDEKGSHAFLLRSNAKTILRADTVPLTIALWRLRMWEGQGWTLTGERRPWGV
ncbi:uncharacterized protein C8Q71DRAFT_800784 [Rhodofomes roseus]|uniref:YlxR domain-containing protein n=1 Tax=Rhodofomes roseus TaxID=34475 RepID=A0ABQ8KYF5_9APHY|nr:uncharacterized protein C8Q71DRAFT_800784 [Rhodofomes roseus]KAH9843925.1 hypothetical protein C8Q71DRAFT_800784 [Rhodofomes roseus]